MAPKKNTATKPDLTEASEVRQTLQTRQSVDNQGAAIARGIKFRLPGVGMMTAILVGMYVTIALGAHYNANLSPVIAQIRDSFYCCSAVSDFLNAVDKYVASYVFFGYQGIALSFIAPAAVAAHVGEALVAVYKIFQARARYGASVCGFGSACVWAFAVFLFGFASLGILSKEIRKLGAK